MNGASVEKSGRRDLNTRSSVPKTDTLPDYATPCCPRADGSRTRTYGPRIMIPMFKPTKLYRLCLNSFPLGPFKVGWFKFLKEKADYHLSHLLDTIYGVKTFHESSSVWVRVVPFLLFSQLFLIFITSSFYLQYEGKQMGLFFFFKSDFLE